MRAGGSGRMGGREQPPADRPTPTSSAPPGGCRWPHPGLVHAPGRPVAAGVPRAAGRHGDARGLPGPRPGHRDHPAAGPPARRRRGDPVLRHRAAAGRRRGRHRDQARRRAGRRPRRCASVADVDALPPLEPDAAGRSCQTAVRAAGRRARADAADRLRRGAVHAGHLPDRGRPVARSTPAPRRSCTPSRRRGRGCWTGWRSSRGDVPARPDRRRRRRGAAVRLVGRARCRPPTTPMRCCRTRAPVLDAVGGPDVPRIHFGVGTGELLRADRRRGRRRRRRRLAGAAGRGRPPASARAARCRATSTPRCCSPTGRRSTARCAGSSSRAGPRAGTSSTSATACCPTPTPACSPTSSSWCTSCPPR